MRLRSDSLFVKPQLPENIREYRVIGASYLGNRLDIVYDASTVSVALQTGGSVVVNGRLIEAQGLQVCPSMCRDLV